MIIPSTFFAEQLKEYRQMFEMVLEGEKQVSQAKENLVGIVSGYVDLFHRSKKRSCP